MIRNNKSIESTIAVILALSSIVLVGTANAETVPKPSVPQFTLTFQDNTFGPSIIVSIINQPFTPYVDSDNKSIQLYYGIRWKGQFTDVWEGNHTFVLQDTSNPHTDFSLGFASKDSTADNSTQIDWRALGNPVDIQVEALIGYAITQSRNTVYKTLTETVILGQASGWSVTKTIVAGNASTSYSPTILPPSATPNLIPTPTVPEASATFTVTFLIISVITVAVVSRTKHPKAYS